MKKHFYFPLILASTFLIQSCATIVTPSSTMVSFKSEPSGARVFLNDMEACTTPCDYPVTRKQRSHIVSYKKDGYNTKNFAFQTGMEPWIWGNLLFFYGFGVGAIVDVATGAWVNLDRTSYTYELDKK